MATVIGPFSSILLTFLLFRFLASNARLSEKASFTVSRLSLSKTTSGEGVDGNMDLSALAAFSISVF